MAIAEVILREAAHLFSFHQSVLQRAMRQRHDQRDPSFGPARVPSPFPAARLRGAVTRSAMGTASATPLVCVDLVTGRRCVYRCVVAMLRWSMTSLRIASASPSSTRIEAAACRRLWTVAPFTAPPRGTPHARPQAEDRFGWS